MRSDLLLATVGAIFICHAQGLAFLVDNTAHRAHWVRANDPQPFERASLRRRDLDARAAAKAAIDALNSRFYDSSQDIWAPGDPWWISGVALTGIIEYMIKTNTTDYLAQVKDIVKAQRAPLSWWPQGGGDFRADSTDDTGWWALAMIKLYDLTNDTTYLNISIEDEAYIHQYWTNKPCGGGVYVDIPKQTYKNAIANELYLKLTASLHNRISNDTKYLTRAETAWNWFQGSGMINSDNLINDGLVVGSGGACSNNKLPVWTYNQGVVLGGLVELYRATNDTAYLDTALTIANAVVSSPALSRNGTLTEASCGSGTSSAGDEWSCDSDQQVFKGIFASNLAALDSAVADANAPYAPYLRQNAQTMYASDRRPTSDGTGDLYDVKWAGPFLNATLAKQASAVALLVAVIGEPGGGYT